MVAFGKPGSRLTDLTHTLAVVQLWRDHHSEDAVDYALTVSIALGEALSFWVSVKTADLELASAIIGRAPKRHESVLEAAHKCVETHLGQRYLKR